VHHPVTDAERSTVADSIVLARWFGDNDQVAYLTEQLTTTCRTVAAAGPLCPCGCGYPPEKHVPQVTQLLDHWKQLHGASPSRWPDEIQVAYENTAQIVLSGGVS
jgi:hypothetical protein